MSVVLKPLGDRILVKLARLTEKKIGDQILTIAHSDKKRIQPETAKFRVLGVGVDVPEDIREGNFIVARSDSGAVLSADIITDDEHRLYRIIEYPEILARLDVIDAVVSPTDVLPEKVVI